MTSIEIPSSAVELRTSSARSAFAMAGWPSVNYGAFFFLAGAGIASRGWFGGREGMHTPPTVVVACGAIFALVGLYVAINGIVDVRRKRAIAQRAAAMPAEPWWWDYPWRPEGIGNDTRREIARALGFALFMVIFLTPFHWVGFFARHPFLPFAVGAVIFDLVIVGILFRAARLTLMRRRYGRSWLRFGHFPFHPGERVELSLDGYGGLSAMPRLTGTLRCVQERYETRGTGKNRSTKVICYALWSSTVVAERNRNGGFDFSFDLPADARSSALGERPARYWELAVDSDDVPGVDYSACFFVPVYASAR
jgi:hypothetical protein